MNHTDVYNEMQLQAERIRLAQHNISKLFTRSDIIEFINAKKAREKRVFVPPSLSAKRGSFKKSSPVNHQ